MRVRRHPSQKDYPKRVYVLHTSYRIVFRKNTKFLGLTDQKNRTITLKSGMPPREIFSTFIHECLHVLEFEHDITIPHKSVYKLEKAIFEFLVDNFL